MITVLIVDDEPLIRRGLESMIAWEQAGFRLAGQASNGEEGLEKIRERKPDVVFTDIKMPKMDGISMIREALKEVNPPVFVILSGYNDFEMVRAALRLGAVDYLMKLNLEEEELNRVLKEVSRRVKERRREGKGAREDDFKENFIQEMLQLQTDREFSRQGQSKEFVLLEGRQYRLLCLKEIHGSEPTWNGDQMAGNFLINVCREQMAGDVECYPCRMENAICLYVETREDFPRDTLAFRCQTIEKKIRQYMNLEIGIGVSAVHHNIMHLGNAWEEARQALAFHISGVDRRVHFYTDMFNAEYFETQLEQLSLQPDYTEAMENFMLQLQKYLAQGAAVSEGRKICLQLIQGIYQVEGDSPAFFEKWFGKSYRTKADFEEFQTAEALSGWLLRLEQGLLSFGQEYMGEIYRYKVKKAREYIYENRFQKISLNDVAEKLEITPGYLSRIFKKVTLKSFSDYVAEVKVEEAKKLLLQDNNRIYEVSARLGYDDPYYFSKVFKKVTQMTPSEYIGRN